MLYIEWFRIDYLTVLPIFLLVILGIIIILRVIRRLTRWGPVDVSHVTIEKQIIENIVFDIYKPIQNNEMTPTILYIPPLSIFPPRKDHIATAIALYNFNVVVIPSQIIGSLQCNKLKQNTWIELVERFNPTIGIVFDYAITYLLNNLQTKLVPTKWIFIRPILLNFQIKSIWAMIPFTPMWFARLLYGNFLNKFPYAPLTNATEIQLANTILLGIIHSETSMINSQGKESLQSFSQTNKSNIIEEIQFQQGGWSFYFQETVWFGHLIHIIRTFQEDNKF